MQIHNKKQRTWASNHRCHAEHSAGFWPERARDTWRTCYNVLPYLVKNINSTPNSGLIPSLGKLIVGEKEPYEYLIKSIESFVNQDELLHLMKKNNFKKCTYRNLSGGIVSIHSGWKI